MDVVAHLQRIADRTGDKVLHETARKAHSACSKGLADTPGGMLDCKCMFSLLMSPLVHLVQVTPDQAVELVNLAILTQDHELANFARYCQSVAATNQVGIEPYPGKILEELQKGRTELTTVGRVHTGPGYGAAFSSVTRSTSGSNIAKTAQAPQQIAQENAQQTPREEPAKPTVQQTAPAQTGELKLTMDIVAHLQRIADRTGDRILRDTARKAHSACAKGLNEAPGGMYLSNYG